MFNKKYATPNGLQLALIISLLSVYVVGFLQAATIYVEHIANNPNFSGVWSTLVWQAVPPLLLVAAYFLNPRKKLSQTQRVFEAAILTIVAVSVFMVLTQVSSYLINIGSMMADGSYAAYELSLMAVLLIGFAGILWFLGRTKRWK